MRSCAERKDHVDLGTGLREQARQRADLARPRPEEDAAFAEPDDGRLARRRGITLYSTSPPASSSIARVVSFFSRRS
jgi:hypothetical protein